MGMLAAMAVPSLLNQPGKTHAHVATVKEAALSVAAAFAQFKPDPTVGYTNVKFQDFLLYLNYLRTDTTTNASSVPSGETALDACSTSRPCLQLHSGALLQYSSTNTFSGSNPLRVIQWAIDPDGAGTSAGKVNLLLYANGRVITEQQRVAPLSDGVNTTFGASPVSALLNNPGWITPVEFGK
jgi:hypothetical protein